MITHATQRIFAFCKKRGIALALVSALIPLTTEAQIPNVDASILFSRSTISGTARTAGAGGAFSSVGADLGSLDLNPAGLGLYRSSEIAISPVLRIAADNSAYGNTGMVNIQPGLQFAQAGAVWTKVYSANNDTFSGFASSPGLRSISFAINFQGGTFFGRNQSFSAGSNATSLIDKYAGISNQLGSYQWSLESQLLFEDQGIIGQNGSTYYSNLKGPVNQSGTLNTRGSTSKIMLGFGGNYADKLYFGVSLALPILNYTVNAQITESTDSPASSPVQYQAYQLNTQINESGIGFTAALGLIYKPAPWARFGISYALPTWYFLTETYNTTLLYTDSNGAEGVGAYLDPMNYQLRTPMKGTVGASFYLQDHGFISVDYEFQNLGAMHYSFSGTQAANSDPVNSYMKSTYGFSHTLRAGLEGAIKKLRLRVGYSYTNSPFKSGQNYGPSGYSQSVNSFSAGIGLRFKQIAIDAAYVLSYSKDALSPNFQMPLDQISSHYTLNSVFLSLSYKLSGGRESSKNHPRRSSDQLPRNIDPGDKY